MPEASTRGKGPIRVLYKAGDSAPTSHIPNDVDTVVFISNSDDTVVQVPMNFPDNVVRAFCARSLAGLIITHVRNGAEKGGDNIESLINEKVAQFADGQAYMRNRTGEPKEKATAALDYGYWLPIFKLWATKKAQAAGKGNDAGYIEMTISKVMEFFNSMKPKQARSVLSQWTSDKGGIPDFIAAQADHDKTLAAQKVAHAPKMSTEDELASMFATKPRSKKDA